MVIFHYKTVNNFIKYVIININYFRFLYCSNLWGTDKPTIDEAFGTYIHQKVDINEETSCKKQQFMLLSTISNYHWYNLPSLKSSSSSKSAQHKSTHTGILYSQHVLHDPTCEINEEGFFIWQYILVSPQN